MTAFSPRFLLVPLFALVVIGSLPAPASSGSGVRNEGCGPAIAHISDPTMRAAFARFDRTQSAAAAKVCELYRNGFAR